MTLVLGLRCRDGVVLASDRQRTQGGLRDRIDKVFSTPAGILSGTAGSIAIQQGLYTALRELPIGHQPAIGVARPAILGALATARYRATAALDAPSPGAREVAGLFAWHSAGDHGMHLLRVTGFGHGEFAVQYTAIGGPERLARFALSRSAYLELDTLSIEAASLVAFEAAEDVIEATAEGVALPVQLGVVTPHRCAVLPGVELRALEDSVSLWRERKRGLLARAAPEGPARPDTGVRP